MNEYKTVSKVSSMIQAMAIRFSLEQAGISSIVASSSDDANYAILVPFIHQYNAENVLHPSGPVAEILVARR